MISHQYLRLTFILFTSIVLVLFLPWYLDADRGLILKSNSYNKGTPQNWAVIIGVGNYKDPGLTKLPNAVRDARAINRILVEVGDLFPSNNVLLLTDDTPDPSHRPTRSNILGILGQWVSLAQPNDSLLIYFAGHGVDFNGKLYLMPIDARSSNPEHTGIPYKVFESELDKSPARLSIIILDACHAGKGRGGNEMSRGMMNDLVKYSEGRILLASCKEEEFSHEYNDKNGAFTWFLLDGLSGKADHNNDGVVSAKEVSDYTFHHVRRWAAMNQLKQTPRLKADISGDFILAKVRRDKTNILEPPSASTTKDILIKTIVPLNPKYSASSEDSSQFAAELAFDGNPYTTWRTSLNRGWIMADFGQKRQIAEIRLEVLTDNYGGGVPKNFNIEFFIDGHWIIGYKKYANMKANFKVRLKKPMICTRFRINVHNTISNKLPLSIAEITFR